MRIVSRQCLLLFLSISVSAAAPVSNSPSPVSYEHIVRRDPNYSIHIVRVDLSDPRVAIRIARGGPDPDGDGPWLTTLLPTSEIAERDHFDVAINGDFFEAQATKDVEGRNTGYVRGKPAAPVGTAMTDGVLWHRSDTTRAYLEITSSNIAKIAEGGPADPIDASAREIVGGSQIIVRGGRAILFPGSKFAETRHPRTAVGIDASGRQLTLLVVDGRQPELSIGMTLVELSEEMIRAGCVTAINLDGGGSTTLVYRDAKSKKLAVLNSPSDSRERAVADVLGVTVDANAATDAAKVLNR
jgi:exopolysaccharide biosynthesis protein